MKTVITIIAVIVVAVGVYFIVQHFISEYEDQIQILKQNSLADSTALAKLTKDGETLYQRYARVWNQNDSLQNDISAILRDRKEIIKALTKAEIKIKELESSGGAIIVDTVKKHLVFSDSNAVFYYNLFVDYGKRFHNLKYNIQPFSLNIYTTQRKTDKIFSGYAEFVPKEFNEYFSISNMDVYIDESLITKESDVDPFKFGIAPGVTFGDVNSFNLGASVLLDEKHYIDYKYGFGIKSHNVNYSWLFW